MLPIHYIISSHGGYENSYMLIPTNIEINFYVLKDNLFEGVNRPYEPNYDTVQGRLDMGKRTQIGICKNWPYYRNMNNKLKTRNEFINDYSLSGDLEKKWYSGIICCSRNLLIKKRKKRKNADVVFNIDDKGGIYLSYALTLIQKFHKKYFKSDQEIIIHCLFCRAKSHIYPRSSPSIIIQNPNNYSFKNIFNKSELNNISKKNINIISKIIRTKGYKIPNFVLKFLINLARRSKNEYKLKLQNAFRQLIIKNEQKLSTPQLFYIMSAFTTIKSMKMEKESSRKRVKSIKKFPK